MVPGGAQVRWEASGKVEAELSAFYAIVEGASAVDATFSAAVDAAYEGFELFIANYFTPYYTPHYALADNQTHPEDIFWYTKQWYGQGESESWARDAAAEALFRDGRWLSARAKLAPRSLLCLSADHPGAPLRTRHCADGASARVFWHFGL